MNYEIKVRNLHGTWKMILNEGVYYRACRHANSAPVLTAKGGWMRQSGRLMARHSPSMTDTTYSLTEWHAPRDKIPAQRPAVSPVSAGSTCPSSTDRCTLLQLNKSETPRGQNSHSVVLEEILQPNVQLRSNIWTCKLENQYSIFMLVSKFSFIFF